MIAEEFLEREVGEQRRHLGRSDPQHQEAEEADQRHRDGAHRRDARRPQRSEKFDQSLHEPPR